MDLDKIKINYQQIEELFTAEAPKQQVAYSSIATRMIGVDEDLMLTIKH